MLKKLIKYEFKATNKILLYSYALVLLLSLSVGVMFRINDYAHIDSYQSPIWQNITFGILVTAYIIIAIGCIIVTLILILQRYYKNILGDGGFLMNVIPTKPKNLIFSKLIPGAIQMAASTIVVAVSFTIAVFTALDFADDTVKSVLHELYKVISPSALIIFGVTILIMIMSQIMCFYFAMTLGQKIMPAKRLLGSFLSYIGIYFANNILNGIWMLLMWSSFPTLSSFENDGLTQAALGFAIFAIPVSLVIFTVSFLITNKLLSKKLDLY